MKTQKSVSNILNFSLFNKPGLVLMKTFISKTPDLEAITLAGEEGPLQDDRQTKLD